MVYQWTEELSIRTNGANRKASLRNVYFFTNGTIGEGFLTIGICLCILDMCGINSRFCRKTQWQMFLLVSGRHVGAHVDGHQHGGKSFPIWGKRFSAYLP